MNAAAEKKTTPITDALNEIADDLEVLGFALDGVERLPHTHSVVVSIADRLKKHSSDVTDLAWNFEAMERAAADRRRATD